MTAVGNCGVEEQIKRASDCLQRELKLSSCDMRVCLSRDPTGLTSRCLVHKTWLETVSSSGKVFSPTMHMGLTPVERSALVHQSVAVEPPLQWVYVTVIPKDFTVLPGCVAPVPNHGVVEDSKRSLLAYIDQLADLERRRVWQQFDRFRIHPNNDSGTQPVIGAFVRDFALHMYGVQLLKLEPCEPPSVSIVSETSGRVIPSLCHPNILPLFAALEGEEAFFLLQPYVKHSLCDVILFTPSVLGKSSVKQQFLLYQVLQGLTEVHSHGVPQNRLDLSNILVDEKLWIRLPSPNIFISNQSASKNDENCMDQGAAFHRTLETTGSQLENSARTDLLKFTRHWLKGELSNFDYLMTLNHAAGRLVGNPDHHPVIPWVMDFSVSHGGWRDLTKTKYRLSKGDNQLDFTYEATGMRSSDSVMEHGVLPPHHISDLLSDITYYVYLARRTPKHILCAHVRPLWVPNEYPKSIQRMQNWTPDECIPQFFSDPLVFTSIHPDLPDLEIPSWADSPEDFICQHRAALESSYVSENLHHWIDLAFGYKLSGTAALRAKNVILSLVDPHSTPKGTGIAQLFASAHPRRNALLKSLSRILMAERGLSCSYLFSVQSSKPISFGIDDMPVKIRKAEEQNKAGGSKPSSRRSSGGQLSDETNQEEQDESEFVVEYPAPVVLDNQSSRTSPESNLTETGNISSKSAEDTTTTSTTTTMAGGAASVTTTTEPSDARSRLPTFWKQKSGSVPLNRPTLINYGELPINLREDYDPLLLVDQVTALAKFGNSFLEKHKGLEEVLTEGSTVATCQYTLDNHIHTDLLSVAVLIIESLCPEKSGAVLQLASPATKLPVYRKFLQSREIKLPQFALGFVEQVFSTVLDEEGAPKPVSSDAEMTLSPPQLLVSEFNEQLLFPRYFVHLYEFLSFLVSNVEASEQGWIENPVDIAQQYLPRIFPMLDAEGFDLLLPYLCPLFELPDTRFQATLRLFGEISKRLGPQKTTSLFLKPVLVTMEQPPNPAGHAMLLYRLFIHKLIRGFGLQVFLERFIPFLIKALVKAHDPSAKDIAESRKSRSQEPDTLEKHENTDLKSSATDVPDVLNADARVSLTAADIQDCLLGDESFVNLEACDVDNVANDIMDAESNQLQQQDDAHVATHGDEADPVTAMPECDETESMYETGSQAEASGGWSSKDTNSTGELLLEQFSDPSLQAGVVDVTKVAMDTLEWLSQFLGPILTSAHLVLPLLKSLTAVQPAGDPMVLKNSPIMKMLMSMLDTYGKHYFLEQYLQFAAESVKSYEQRLTAKMEASLSALITLMRQCIRQMPVSTLLNQMEMMSQQIFQRVITILSSPSINFPSGSSTRRNICHQLLDTLLVIANQLGRETAQPVLAVLLQQFFSSFDRVIPTASPDDVSSIKASLSNSVNRKHEELGISEELFLNRISGSEDKEQVADEVLLQLQDVFTPELAQAAYVPFCQLIGQINMRRMLYNADLIEQVSYSHINQHLQRAGESDRRTPQPDLIPSGSHKMQATEKLNLAVVDATHNNPLQPGSSDDDSEEELDLSQVNFGKSSWFIELGAGGEASANPDPAFSSDGTSQPELRSVSGQLLDQFEAARVKYNQILGSGSRSSDDGGGSGTPMPDSSKATSKGHLEGNWLAHWRNQLGSHVRSPFGFDHLKLQTYSGHTGFVRSLCAVDGQRMFLSGSRDRTVRLWSLSSQGDGSAEIPCQLTYRRHQKTVLAVEYLERTGSVISCSGSIHIWDPDTAQCLKRLESARSPVVAMSCLPPPHSTAVIATSDGTLKFVDVRIGKFMHDWKIQAAGVPRSMCVDHDGRYIIVGLSFGFLTLLDVRTGLCIKKWKPHEGDITKIRAMADKFVVASNDGPLTMWQSNGGSRGTELKGHTEAVFDCQIYRDDIISVTSNRLGIHTIYDKESTFGSYRIRPDLVKSGPSALDLLPLSRELIIGTDSGHIYLCA